MNLARFVMKNSTHYKSLLPPFLSFPPSVYFPLHPLLKPVKVNLCLLSDIRDSSLPRVYHRQTLSYKNEKENHLLLRVSSPKAKGTCKSQQNAVIVASLAVKTEKRLRFLPVVCVDKSPVKLQGSVLAYDRAIANVDISCHCWPMLFVRKRQF